MFATVTQSRSGTGRSISIPKLPPVTSAPPFFNLAALGLFAVGLTTVLLSVVNANFVGPAIAPKPLAVITKLQGEPS
jgi:succinate-acetate transporter protein